MEDLQRIVSFLFNKVNRDTESLPIMLCLSFLKVLSSPSRDSDVEDSLDRLKKFCKDPIWGDLSKLFYYGVDIVIREVETALQCDKTFGEHLHLLASGSRSICESGPPRPEDLNRHLWNVFCPQAVDVKEHWDEKVRELRERRTIKIMSLCNKPVKEPSREILFTANALLTLPPRGLAPGELHLDEGIRRSLSRVIGEDPSYWYDHPLQIGTPPEHNEILYGLRGLSDMFQFEKKRGNAGRMDKLEVVLSSSVTHRGLTEIARTYIESEVLKNGGIRDINLYIFTERDTSRIIEDFLCPAAKIFGIEGGDPSFFSTVFGVDGAYGRHYNFLKAVSALWNAAINPRIEATFKIDLDQVFPQERLVQELGCSAFDLLRSPLWGAGGYDSAGDPVSLGMIAGALVNGADIHKGLFSPDVTLPNEQHLNDFRIFASRVPQALSTEAEMMTRYEDDDLNGRSHCLSRIHVTGGTVGIRVDSLFHYRPFTLSSIGRAEDQAYIMSVLFDHGPPYLRYAHIPGLIMSHDKHTLAAGAIQAAAAGKVIGDYERMLLFSHYARALPWPAQKIQSALDPYTGCFILSIPDTTVLLSLALNALSLCDGRHDSSGLKADELLSVGAARLLPILRELNKEPERTRLLYENERKVWNSYYSILEKIRSELQKGSAEAAQLIRNTESIIRETRIAMK